MGLVRSIFWFDQGELQQITKGIGTNKYGYEAQWQANVLFALLFGCVFAFIASPWAGLAYAFWAKVATQSLYRKKFFDPLPSAQ